MRSVSQLLALALVVMSTIATRAHAEEPSYDSTIDAALDEYQLGHWAEAIALFERAHELRPSARTLRGLALAHFENRQYVKALGYGKQALESDVRPLSAKQRKHLDRVVARANDFIARLSVTTDPADASLTVDGYPVVKDAEGAVLLDPGEHELIARTESGQSERRKISAESGRTGSLTIRIPDEADGPSASVVAGTTPALQDSATDDTTGAVATEDLAVEGSSGSIGPWIVMGTGGALLVASAITGALTKGAEDDLLAANCEVQCDPSFGDTVDRGETLQLTTNILLGVGITAVVGGAVWWLLDGSSSESDDAVTASAACLPEFCGAAVHAAF